MNKELFVSSTPHETKVGLVEDDLLAEIYMERENEYTLAGSIYKGKVTRVLPGMQSAFVDIGLERDAFLYVSDFMELEEHDEDLTDAVPANRPVQEARPVAEDEVAQAPAAAEAGEFEEAEAVEEGPAAASASPDAGGEQGRDRGGFRGRRRRRGGRRDGRERGSERGGERGPDRGDRGGERSSEQRFRSPEPTPSRSQGYERPSGPPAGYTPILLPGESLSKYRNRPPQAVIEDHPVAAVADEQPVASSFPEDEPIFAAGEAVVAEPLHEEHHDAPAAHEEPVESASVSTNWNQEFRSSAVEEPVVEEEVEEFEEEAHEPEQRLEPVAEQPLPPLGWPGEHTLTEPEDVVEPGEHEEEHAEPRAASSYDDSKPVFAAPGTMEEETIDEEEADHVHYESSSDEGYDEFEEETRAVNGDVRDAVAEIHMESLADAGVAPAEGAHEEDSEEIELEEAQAEAEAMLDAEARGNGTVDARVEVRAPSGNAGYTQRAPRERFQRGRGDRRRGGGGGQRRGFRRRESAPVPLISDLLKEGQEILVQIAKEPIGKKGARITSHIALPGRFLVYMPTVNHTGVSRKIASEEERQRLKRIIQSERENGHGGFIVRTAAQSASEDELRADIRFLKGLWHDIKTRSEASKPPSLIYHDLNVVERVLRDQVTSDFNVIWVDTEPEYERILRFFNRFQPNMVKRVKLYTKEVPLFEQFGLKDEMDKALKSKVWLKSGGYIVINQTEALVAIDINTGKYVGKTARLEDTIVKTNVDAIKEIVRQIRLRDLGGIIIIDFIDMDERRNRQRVMQALEEELRHDRAPSKTLQFNDFGLVAITRKRVKQSLERTIGAPCPYCQSTGYVKSVTTVCNEIYVEMRKIAKHLERADVMLRVHPDVAKELKTNNGRLLNEMEEMTKRTIIVKSDPALHQEQFDIN